jgi:hypothetical protein
MVGVALATLDMEPEQSIPDVIDVLDKGFALLEAGLPL